MVNSLPKLSHNNSWNNNILYTFWIARTVQKQSLRLPQHVRTQSLISYDGQPRDVAICNKFSHTSSLQAQSWAMNAINFPTTSLGLKLMSNATCIASTSSDKASTSILISTSKLSSNLLRSCCADSELGAWIFFFVWPMPGTLSAVTK